MQKQIKFRAWDKENRKMYFDVQDAYDTLGYHCKHSEEERQNCECNFDDPFLPASFGSVLVDNDYVVMQFTGLLDKNGKEIYEGDLIGYWHETFWTVGWSEEKGKYMFQYPGTSNDIIPSTGESLKGKDGFTVSRSVCSKKEIVGNIYENPNLLQ